MSKFYRLNEYIQAAKLRVVDAEGNQLGVITKEEAINKAKESEMDLVEVAPNADPPVAKIVDFQKFKYEESKKEKAARKGGNEGGLKELWFSPRIAEHDLKVRLNKIEDFLKDGYKVKLTVKFKGREMTHPEFGQQVLQKALAYFEGQVTVDREPRLEGRRLSVIVGKAKHVQSKDEKIS